MKHTHTTWILREIHCLTSDSHIFYLVWVFVSRLKTVNESLVTICYVIKICLVYHGIFKDVKRSITIEKTDLNLIFSMLYLRHRNNFQSDFECELYVALFYQTNKIQDISFFQWWAGRFYQKDFKREYWKYKIQLWQ